MQFIKNMVEKNGKKKTWWLLGLLFVGIMLLVVSTLFANRQGGGNNDNWQVSPIDFDAQDNYGNYQLSIINYQLTESLSQYLTRQLEEILSLVAGAGNVRVMLTMGSGASVFAQNTQTSHSATTEDDGEGGTRAIDTETSQITY
ncbi:MAG: hypothetical protein FWB74_02310, partial [Defluviitaleaceae bacterium]|nr:hypothetical protein [Defluviitaleaceae bacterium]